MITANLLIKISVAKLRCATWPTFLNDSVCICVTELTPREGHATPGVDRRQNSESTYHVICDAVLNCLCRRTNQLRLTAAAVCHSTFHVFISKTIFARRDVHDRICIHS